jgi:hypothetical protein
MALRPLYSISVKNAKDCGHTSVNLTFVRGGEHDGNEAKWRDDHKDETSTLMSRPFSATAVNTIHADKDGFHRYLSALLRSKLETEESGGPIL